MEPLMRIACDVTVAAVAAVVILGAAGCLDPLAKDKPGASSHLLPPGSQVPSAADIDELRIQIGLNDGLDDTALKDNVVKRGSGMSAGAAVRFWSFGPITRAPSPIYEFVKRTGKLPPDPEFMPIDHPPLLDALPGDHGYSPVHGLNRVVVTDAYADELITSIEALGDAIDLGLVEEPVPLKMFVDSPVVLPATMLEVSGIPPDTMKTPPEIVFVRGYTAGMFRFGGPRGVQPQPAGGVLLPVSQVSFLRGPQGGAYDATRPIFQATIPAAPPAPPNEKDYNYTPLSVVIEVDLTVSASGITDDSQLFTRSATGSITGTTGMVEGFQITSSIQLLQLQFEDGAP